MSNFKTGDIVKISPILLNDDYDESFHCYVDKLATITGTHNGTFGIAYSLDIDNGRWWWYDYELIAMDNKKCESCEQYNTCNKVKCKKEDKHG